MRARYDVAIVGYGPVGQTLAILLGSIAGLIVLGVKTAGPEGASASHGPSAGHGVAGKIVADSGNQHATAVPLFSLRGPLYHPAGRRRETRRARCGVG